MPFRATDIDRSVPCHEFTGCRCTAALIPDHITRRCRAANPPHLALYLLGDPHLRNRALSAKRYSFRAGSGQVALDGLRCLAPLAGQVWSRLNAGSDLTRPSATSANEQGGLRERSAIA